MTYEENVWRKEAIRLNEELSTVLVNLERISLGEYQVLRRGSWRWKINDKVISGAYEGASLKSVLELMPGTVLIAEINEDIALVSQPRKDPTTDD